MGNSIQDDTLRLIDDIPSLIWRAGRDGQFYYFNRAWLEFTGRSLEQEAGSGWLNGVHPNDRDQVEELTRQAFQTQQPFELEYRLLHYSGEFCWILVKGRPIADSAGKFSGFLGVCIDITERKEIENSLRESEAMFKGLFEFAPDGVIVVDADGRIRLVNHQAQEMFGYTRDEMLGRSIETLMAERYQSMHTRRVSEFFQSPAVRPMGKCLALFAKRKDGVQFPVDITLGPLDIGDQRLVLATVRDITERKQTEASLSDRDKMIHTAIEAAPIVFFKLDREGIIKISLGKSLARTLHGINPVGQSVYEIYADVPELIQCFERALDGEAFTITLEADEMVFEASYAPMIDEMGEVTGVVGVATDITEHRKVQEALRLSEQRFHKIFDEASLGVFLIDLDGRLVESNPALHAMLGYSPQALQQKTVLEIIHPMEVPAWKRLLTDLVGGQMDNFQGQQVYQRQDGKLVWGQLSMSLFRDDNGEPLYAVGLVENITDRKTIQAELAEVQRRLLDSGEAERLHLAQELHDGPLQELHGVAYQLSSLVDAIESETEKQQLIEAKESLFSAIHTLRATTGELRPPALAPFGLERAIRSHAETIQDQHPELELALDLKPDGQQLPERVRLAFYRIYQHGLSNVIRHAEAKHVIVNFTFDDEKIRLEIRDDGRGFEVPSRWVQLVRKGHFGLVGSTERAEAVGGKLKIESRLGQGTTVIVEAPRQETLQVAPAEQFTISY